MPYTNATYTKTQEGRTVTYTDGTGNVEIRVGGTRSWRNNNPGNIIYGDWAENHGAIGKDSDGFAIFPDAATGTTAKEDLLRGKYGEYDSIREMLKGKFDADGKYIPNTGYAPANDGNNPDAYANQIKKWTDLDVDTRKINDLTDEEMQKLLDAMKRYEGWRAGTGYVKDNEGNISPLEGQNNQIPGISPASKICAQCHDKFNTGKTKISPLAIDLDGDGVETINVKDGAYFDHDDNGFAQQTGWVGSDDGLLVMDRDGNGVIDSGKELFGSETILENGNKASNGFQALADLDDNADGKIDVNDAAFSQLKVWQDVEIIKTFLYKTACLR